MAKKNTFKGALIAAIISMIVCVSMFVGTTFAWFTDSVTSAKNTIASGNLNIEMEHYTGTSWETVEGASDVFDPQALWEPGRMDVA